MMKHSFIAVLALLSIPTIANAQVKVAANGKVGVGLSSTSTPISQLAVGGAGSSYAKGYIEGNDIVFKVKSLGKSTSSPSYIYGTGIEITGPVATGSGNVGLESTLSGSYSSSNEFAAGVIGKAGNGKNGYNYGVSGCLQGSKSGAGIFGSVNGNGRGTSIPGRYAGYFEGNVGIHGNLFMKMANNIFLYADGNFMPNQQAIDTVLNKVLALTPVHYYYASNPTGLFGIPAGNLGNYFPELTTTGDNNILMANYIGLIPVLVQAIKELNAKIVELQESIPMLQRNAMQVETNSVEPQARALTDAVLYQNNPNPFSSRTEIRFRLPENAPQSYICIFDMTGKMLKQVPVDSSMRSISVNGYELPAGIYLYSLIIGGREIDTKRMILSK